MRAIVYILGNAVGKYTKNNGMLLDGACRGGSMAIVQLPAHIHESTTVVLLICDATVCALCLFPGKYGTQLGPLFLLHMLYISVSVWACFRIFSQPSTQDVQPVSHDG